MTPSNCRRAHLWILVAALALFSAPSKASPPDARAGDRPKPTLIFITKSDACDCVYNRCIVGEQEVINFMTGTPYNFRLEKVDLADTPEAGQTYRALTLPVAILQDAAGETVARFDSFFTEAQLTAVWKQHLAARGVTP